MKGIFTNKWGVIAIAIVCTFLWGSAFPSLKISNIELQIAPNDTNAQIVFAGMRFLLAGLMILTVLTLVNRKILRVKKSQIPILILFGLIQTTGQYYFFYIGLSNVSGMQGAILSSSGIFFAVIIAHFFYMNDKMNRQKTIGIIAGISGIIVANWGQDFHFQFQLTGEGFMILSALLSAITTIMSKELSNGIHPVVLTGWQLTIGAIILLMIGLPQMSTDAIQFTPFGWGLLIYLAFLSAVAFALWTTLLKYNKAGEMAIYNFLTPVFGAILSALFVPNEHFNIYVLGAMTLVSIGIISINYRSNKINWMLSPLRYK